jgi:hypothetical protein
VAISWRPVAASDSPLVVPLFFLYLYLLIRPHPTKKSALLHIISPVPPGLMAAVYCDVCHNSIESPSCHQELCLLYCAVLGWGDSRLMSYAMHQYPGGKGVRYGYAHGALGTTKAGGGGRCDKGHPIFGVFVHVRSFLAFWAPKAPLMKSPGARGLKS